MAAPRFVVQVPPAYAPERRYVLDLILGEWLGFECDLVPGPPGDLVIRLDGDPEGRLLSLPDALFATPAAAPLMVLRRACRRQSRFTAPVSTISRMSLSTSSSINSL